MYWNLPPGVSANDYNISGFRDEWDEEGTCHVCDKDGVLHHAYHPQTGHLVFCFDESCSAYDDPYEIDDEPDPMDEYHRHKEDELIDEGY